MSSASLAISPGRRSRDRLGNARLRWQTAAVASAAAAITLAVALAPSRGVAEPGLTLRIVMETAAALTAVLAAALLVRVTLPQLDRRWVALALVVLAAGAVATGLLAEVAGLWAAILLAVAAWPRVRPAPAVVACVVLVGGAIALPGPAVHLLAAAVLAGAAAGFDRRGTPWLAVAVTLGAFAEVNHAVVEQAVADGFGLLSHAVFLLAAYQLFVDDVVRGERRRIARDLHDGVTQELVYIQRRAPHLAESDLGREITAAAERAQAESRQVIERLAGPAVQSLEAVAEDCGIALELSGEPLRPELDRIAAEAVRNAACHGCARTVRVHMNGGRLRISDDGIGFDPERATRGFGLTSMRERAEALGGAFRVRSRPGHGAEIEVELP
jgi:signal transduction histidine kinase